VTLPDEKKGEQIILLTTETTATREAVMKALKEQKLPELANPRAVHVVAAIPLLGTGKIDYVGAKALAEML